MNKQLAILLKAHLLGQLRVNDLKSSNHSKVKKHAILMTILYLILIPVFGGYSYATAYGLCYMGIPQLIPAYAFVITALLTIFFTIIKANGILFDFKDYEMLTALPIKTHTIVQSRFYILYILNLLFVLIIMVPMGIAYVVACKPSGLFYGVWLVGILVASFLPTIIGTVIGAIIVAISSRFRYSNAVGTIGIILFIIMVLVGSFSLGAVDQNEFSVQNMAAIGTMLSEKLCDLYPPASFFSKAVLEGDLGAAGLLVGSTILGYALFIVLLSKIYRRLNSSLHGHYAKSDYKVKTLKQSSVLGTLFKKEWKRFLTSSVYVTNIGVGVLMALLFAIACVVLGFEKISGIVNVPGFEAIILRILPFVVAALLGMSCTSSVSLSLEGKNIWIVQSLPISVKTILDSKILVNVSLLLPNAVLIGILFSIRFATDVTTVFFLFAVPVVYVIFTSVYGMFINVHFVNYEWESEVQVVKQSLPSMFGMFGSPLAAIIPAVLLSIFNEVSVVLFSGAIIIMMLLISAFLYSRLCKVKSL